MDTHINIFISISIFGNVYKHAIRVTVYCSNPNIIILVSNVTLNETQEPKFIYTKNANQKQIFSNID